MSALSDRLYTAGDVRRLDAAAMAAEGIDGYALMCRAGNAVFDQARAMSGESPRWLVLCGAGNNAGDGYVIARLARAAGIDVQVLSLVPPGQLRGAASKAASAFLDTGAEWLPWEGVLPSADLVIDAMLGTGLDRPVSGAWRDVIAAANRCEGRRLAVDIPSGLCADTGRVLGIAFEAECTVTLIGIKRGLLTADGPDHAGQVIFESLDVQATIHADIAAGECLRRPMLVRELPPRRRNSHKGTYGAVCVVGGNIGMSGAARLAGEAALRSGAGRVTVATHPEHAAFVNLGRPELMTCSVEGGGRLPAAAGTADVIAIGPGLGRDGWARALFEDCLASALPLIIDADALNLLAATGEHTIVTAAAPWVLTPHPAEAARLLGIATADVQADRFAAAARLSQRFNAVVILKGCGTVVAHPGGAWAVCPLGNPGMATAGSGDVLTGICAAMLAQGLEPWTAARCAVVAHAAAGDDAADPGWRGSLAGDICNAIPGVFDED